MSKSMSGAALVAEILKREGCEFLIGYPVNPIIEAAAAADIRTVIVRQDGVYGFLRKASISIFLFLTWRVSGYPKGLQK